MKLSGGVKAGLGVAAVAATALVPLYGDPRVSAVSHPEWARMLLHGLDLSAAIPRSAPASLVFSVLSWKTSLTHRADSYLRADGMTPAGDRQRHLLAVADPGEAAYALAVARPGDYRVRLRLSGNPENPATVEIARAEDPEGAVDFSLRPPAAPGWVDAGTAHLASGAWTAAVALPAGAVLEAIEVAPPCLNPIEPLGGWRAVRTTDTADLAVTVLKALDLESELPPSDAALDIPATSFHAQDPVAISVGASSVDGYRVAGGANGLRAEVLVEVPEDGLYTLSFFGLRGRGQRWAADGCHKVIVCGDEQEPGPPSWHALGTLRLSAGRHVFTVALGPGATLERMRLGRRKDAGADYVATLRRLGFDPGDDGPVTRAKAEEAVEFLRQRRDERPTPECGDWDLPPPGVMYAEASSGFAAPPTGTGGIVTTPPGGGGQPPPPLTPPGVPPPQDPASPVVP